MNPNGRRVLNDVRVALHNRNRDDNSDSDNDNGNDNDDLYDSNETYTDSDYRGSDTEDSNTDDSSNEGSVFNNRRINANYRGIINLHEAVVSDSDNRPPLNFVPRGNGEVCDCDMFGFFPCILQSWTNDNAPLNLTSLLLEAEVTANHILRKPNHLLRKQMYRKIYANLPYAEFGEGQRMELPSCAVGMARQLYPSGKPFLVKHRLLRVRHPEHNFACRWTSRISSPILSEVPMKAPPTDLNSRCFRTGVGSVCVQE